MREIRPCTRIVDAFADGKIALNQAAARLSHVAGSCRSTRRDLNMKLLKD
jgi:hypothetical protein